MALANIATNAHWHRVIAPTLELLRSRREEVEALLSNGQKDQLLDRIGVLRQRFTTAVGIDFPRSPLNLDTAETIRLEDYAIERVAIEALPGYWIPVNVYKPEPASGEPLSTILVAVGHYWQGKAHRDTQALCATLARNGFLAATYDPMCQGERDEFPPEEFPQYASEREKEDMWVVAQHMLVGDQSYLLGESSAKYYIWDAIRVLDYLLERQDVRTDTVGCVGQSGGGTLTYYLAALDSRIHAYMPIQCLSPYEISLKSGIADPEQSVLGLWQDGFEMADFLWMAAPKPLCISAGSRDYFSAAGARSIYEEVRQLYTRLGFPDNVEYFESDTAHALSAQPRAACYEWFSRRFHDAPHERERQVELLTEEDLHCLSPEARASNRTPLDINRIRLGSIRDTRCRGVELSGSATMDSCAEEALRRLVPAEPVRYSVDDLGKSGHVHEVSISTDASYSIHCRIRRQEAAERVLFLIDFRNSIDEEELLEKCDRTNLVTLKPFAMASTRQRSNHDYDTEAAIAYAHLVLGRSMLVARVTEVLTAVDYFADEWFPGLPFSFVGTGQGGLISIISSLLEERTAGAIAIETLASYDAVFEDKDFFVNQTDIVPGFTKELDVQYLLSISTRKRILLLNPRDPRDRPVADEELGTYFDVAQRALRNAPRGYSLPVENCDSGDYGSIIAGWVEDVHAATEHT